MKKWIVRQRDAKDCGVCCLLSLIKYYGGYVPLETLREDTYTTNQGTSAYNLVQTLKKYGFETQGLAVNGKEFKNINLPAIAHVLIDNKRSHFVVIYKINNNYITIMDPGRGIVKLNYEIWNQIFKGKIIVCNPINKMISIDKPKNIFNLFKNIVNNEKKLMLKIVLVSIILTIVSILSSFYIKFAFNSLNKMNDFIELKTTILIFLLITIIKIFTTYIRTYYEIYLNKNIDLNLIFPFLKHLYLIPLSSIKSRSVGDIIERIDELDNIKELFSKIFIAIFLDIFLALSTFIVLVKINKNLTIIVLITLILYGIFGFLISPIIKTKAKENIEKDTIYRSCLIESISGIQSIKNLNNYNFFINNLFEKLLNYLKHSFKFKHMINTQSLIKDFINEIGLFVILSYGIILINNNELTIINLIAFSNVVTFLITPFKNIIDQLPRIEFIKASYSKINDFISFEEEKFDDSNESLKPENILIKNLTYSYNGYNQVLKGINLEIKKHEKILIIGKSGLGKSTLCKILLRTYKYDGGDIFINKINLRDYSLNTIRNNICYISQDEVLFSDTLYNNLVLDKKLSTAEFDSITKLCKVNEIVKDKPLRFNTFLLEQGSNLSGGEKQRIVLARGLIRNCPIIILDESLSEVSEDMEKEIISNILTRFKQHIIIYISHHDIKGLFDRVINLEDCYE